MKLTRKKILYLTNILKSLMAIFFIKTLYTNILYGMLYNIHI